MNVGWYVTRRAALSFFVVIGTIVVTFYLSHLLPGNPAVLYAGSNPGPEEIQRITEQYGFNKPPLTQFWIYLSSIFRGDLGTSVVVRQPVASLVAQALPNSLVLAAMAATIAAIVGIPLGILAARSRNSKLDNFLRIFSMSAVALPQFWSGLILQLVFFSSLHLFPLGAYGGSLFFLSQHPIPRITGSYFVDALLSGNFAAEGQILWSLVLPLVTLSAYPIGVIIRQTRASMIGVLNQDYIRTARAYGLPRLEVETKFALKNALAPVLVSLGLIFAGSLIGVVFVEDIFVLQPGLGSLIRTGLGVGTTSTSISTPDVPLILGVAIVTCIVYVVTNFAVDMIQLVVDRRITV
ncbi:MAG: ABC transporter permease [Nitrososphaerales archaeon]|nr:ABC transporter permease [Nitrososphaerales archaeon]